MNKLATAIIAMGISGALLWNGSVNAASSQAHTVIQNDTFWKLSIKYNVSLDAILQANSTIDPLQLRIGQKLVIPASAKAAMTSTAPVKAFGSNSQSSVIAPDGQAYTYSKQLNVKATAYTAAASENGKWGAVDYFGNKLKVGTIAVDPNMIPLGTKLYITGYNYNGLPTGGMIATATDMGGSIKGNRIDIFVPGSTKQALKFGIQSVKAYIINEA